MGTWPHGHLLIDHYLAEKEAGMYLEEHNTPLENFLNRIDYLEKRVIDLEEKIDTHDHVLYYAEQLWKKTSPDDYDTQQQVEEDDYYEEDDFDGEIPEDILDILLNPADGNKPIDMKIVGENGESIVLKFPSLEEALKFTSRIE